MTSIPALLARQVDPGQWTDHSFYMDAKTWLLSVLPVPKPVIHVVIGLVALAVAVTVLRRSGASFTALIPGLLLSLVMEGFDLHDDKMMINRFRWVESVKDLVVTNLLPFGIVLYNRSAGSGDDVAGEGTLGRESPTG